MFVALLDTSVLWPSLQRDFLLSLAAEGIYRPVWSAQILAELEYEQARKLVARHGLDHSDATQSAARLVATMRSAFDDAEVTHRADRAVRRGPPTPTGAAGLAVSTPRADRAGLGLALLIRPDAGARLLGRRSAGPHQVLRVLGLRHLAEAGALVLRPDRSTATAACPVDGTPVLSCLLFAAVDPQRRRPALRDAAVEAAVLAGTWLARG